MRLTRDARSRAPRRAGFTVLEVLISATVFTLIGGAVVTSIALSSALNTTNRETMLASQAAQSMLEELKGTTFSEIFARYDATVADDPAGGVSPGSSFAVSGLDPQAGDADGLVGAIEFPGTGVTLREDGNDLELGLPRDLDGDGAIDATDHAADYIVLPVRVTIAWRGKTGDRTLELSTVLADL